MNWCKVGRHDDVIFDDHDKVMSALHTILLSYDFEREESSGRYWYIGTAYVHHDMTIWDYQISNLFPEITTRHLTRLYTKVCVNCKRIKRSYNILDLECMLISLVSKTADEASRQQRAKDILKDRYQ